MAARPNEQPIKGRVRPFRESPAGIPPGEEENLGEAVYVAETKTGGGQFSRKRNVPRPLCGILRFLLSDSRKKDEKDLCCLNFAFDGWKIFLEYILNFLLPRNEIFKNSIRRNSPHECGSSRNVKTCY